MKLEIRWSLCPGKWFRGNYRFANKMAKSLGFIDYYDYKVTNAEGFGKAKLFEILDGLRRALIHHGGRTRGVGQASRERRPRAVEHTF
jgi:hypothetical protein